jgi:hypothetical protein
MLMGLVAHEDVLQVQLDELLLCVLLTQLGDLDKLIQRCMGLLINDSFALTLHMRLINHSLALALHLN